MPLESGAIAGAALDVFKTEPLPASSPLWELENVIISSHGADQTEEFHAQGWHVFKQNFEGFVANGVDGLLTVMDKAGGY